MNACIECLLDFGQLEKNSSREPYTFKHTSATHRHNMVEDYPVTPGSMGNGVYCFLGEISKEEMLKVDWESQVPACDARWITKVFPLQQKGCNVSYFMS